MGGSDLFTIGRVTGIHGLKGYLKVQSFAESISVFKAGMKLHVRSPREKTGVWHEIVNASPYKKGLRLLLKGVDINDASDLVGKELLARREDCYNSRSDSNCGVNSEVGLGEDTYFWEDLIGLSVVDVRDGYLGRIDAVMVTGSNDVFVVKGGKREVLVPGLKSVVLSVDMDKNEMRIDLPEGL